MKVVGASGYFALSEIVRSATYSVLQPGQWIFRVSFPRASSTLNVKNRGFPHFGQEYCTAPVVIQAGMAGLYNGLPSNDYRVARTYNWPYWGRARLRTRTKCAYRRKRPISKTTRNLSPTATFPGT